MPELGQYTPDADKWKMDVMLWLGLWGCVVVVVVVVLTIWRLLHIPGGGGGGGGTGSGFIQFHAALGSEPLPYFRESRTPKTYPILGKSHNPGHPKRSGLQKPYPILGKISQFRAAEVVRTPKTYPIFGKFDKIIPYFREIW